MVHSVESILGHLKNWYEPSPGDLVWTGTPKGVGAMHEGDVVECWMKNSEGETVSVLNAKCVV
jgi:2-keto-4-pentenoate hydratase/2-oxohepta-3-ene-1,7-dioic acid hydratase in catechol pathway